MLSRYLLPAWLLLYSLAVACQPAAQSLSPATPLGPAATPGQPGQWDGPPAPAASPKQHVTARVVPFWQAGKYGLITPQGQVVLAATSPTMPVPLTRHVWAANAPLGSALRLVVLTDSGRVLGHYNTATRAGGAWGWVQAAGADGTITLYDSLGRLLRHTPYGKLEQPAEGRLVVALPDSPPNRAGGYTPGLRGVIDSLGREVVAPRYTALDSYHRGYAFATLETPWPEQKLLHKGVLDRNGRPHWLPDQPQWYSASMRYEGGFFAGRSNDEQAAAALTVDGQVLIPYSAKMQQITREPFAQVQPDLVQVEGLDLTVPGHPRRGTGLYTFAGGQFQPLLPLRYERLEPRTRSWTILHAYDPAWPGRMSGYGEPPTRGAAWRGRLVIPAEYNGLEITPDGRFAIASRYDPATRTWRSVVSEYGRPPQTLAAGIESFRYVGHGVFAVQRQQRWGLERADGQVLRPCRDADPLDKLQQGLYFYQGAGPQGLPLVDTLGHPVLRAGDYEEAGFFTPTLAWVKKQGRYGIFSQRTGQLVAPIGFEQLPTTQLDGTYWGTQAGKVLVGHGEDAPLLLDQASFQPLVVKWPHLVLGSGAGGWQLYNRQGQLLSTQVTRLEGQYRDGVIWAANEQNRYALLDTRGRQLTPFSYELLIDLHENWAPFAQGLGLARNAAGTLVVIDCLGRAYAW